MDMRTVAGVDVGGRRKGFHVALIHGPRLVETPRQLSTPEAVVRHLARHCPALVAVDSPVAPAADGECLRPEERRLAAQVCNIRWTPDRPHLGSNRYYEWIQHGFQLYRALGDAQLPTIECFPTASFTRWHGRRNGQSRARWSREALMRLNLDGVPPRSSQDDRDAIAAAVTAWQHTWRQTECFGAIVVPTRRPDWSGKSAIA